MFIYTAESSTLSVWRRNALDLQRDWMTSFHELACIGRSKLGASECDAHAKRRWWPWHLLAAEIMAGAEGILTGTAI